jgi:phage/plasmid-like protein (TIGR03299 family)
MSDNIAIINGQASMVYNKEVPWHGLGTRFENLMTVEEALKASHCDYDVELWPMRYIDPHVPNGDGDQFAAEDVFTTVRTDTKDALGYVGPDYNVVQNGGPDGAFNFLSSIIDSKAAVIETMGALGKGEKAWALLKLPDNIIVTKKDEVGKYVLVYNSFNGKSKIRAKYTPIRVVCQNTLNMALQGTDTEVAIRHTTNAQSMLAEASKVMGMATAVSVKLEPVFKAMALRKITSQDLLDYVKTLIPIEKDAKRTARKEAIHAEIIRLHDAGLGADVSRGTLWGAYNAVTEYVDHVYSGKSSPSARLNTIWFGSGESIKIDAFTLAFQLLRKN